VLNDMRDVAVEDEIFSFCLITLCVVCVATCAFRSS
jgi:hypothetical protein